MIFLDKRIIRSAQKHITFVLALLLTGLLTQPPAQAQLPKISQTPLFLASNIAPNVFIELDDSGSMDWEILTKPYWHACRYKEESCSWGDPITNGLWRSRRSSSGFEYFYYFFDEDDHAYGGSCSESRERVEDCGSYPTNYDWRGRSADFNVLYYNPKVNYKPWPGTGLTDGSFTAARSNPQSGEDGYRSQRNLTNFVYEVWNDNKGYKGSKPNGADDIDMTDGANGEVDLWDSHTEITIKSGYLSIKRYDYSKRRNGFDEEVTSSTPTRLPAEYCAPACANGRSLAEEKQNIANWYQYARRRSFVAKGAIAEVIAQNSKYRYGLSVINQYSKLFEEMPAADVTDFSAHNSTILKNLFKFDWPARGTPLRRALKRTGNYYADNLSGKSSPIISECQQNFTLLLTDGYWNGGSPEVSDVDEDDHSNTLADVARYFYENDLRTDLENLVPVNAFDTENHQHMVTFTAAFGVQGELVDTDDDGWPNNDDGNLTESGDWGNPNSCSDCPEKIDDLWHAAYNSRGQFVSARTPQELVDGVQSALSTISNRLSSASAVATTASVIQTDTRIYQARFDSGNWSGQLRALPVDSDGNVDTTNPVWDTKEQDSIFNNQNWNSDRQIITYKPSNKQGIKFRWPGNPSSPGGHQLDPEQIAFLQDDPRTEVLDNDGEGQARLQYLRGNSKNESSGNNYRERASALGDLVNSKPIHVGAPFFFYLDELEATSYQDFKNQWSTRKPILYVGSNDGMLHGFDANTGKEEIAYIPNSVFKNLNKLTDPNYNHQFFVDGQSTAGDAYLSSRGGWRTVLVGSLGGGGQGLFALDITDPEQFSNENDARKIVLWEFSDSDDADLGYTYGESTIAKTAEGRWGVIVGNGHNNSEADGNASTTGHAVLYILDISDGQIIRKIDTGVGSTDSPNALSSPEPIDANGDSIVDFIYAGDSYGNLWVFDVRDSDPANWRIAYDKPIFTGSDGQSITIRPRVTRHPLEPDGYLVYFGTGQYLYEGDHSPDDQPTQSVYAVWDKNQPIWDAAQQIWIVWDNSTDEWIEAESDDRSSPSSATLKRSDLLQQSVISESDWRLTSNEVIEWLVDASRTTSGQTEGKHLGWYLDFISGGNNNGERIVSDLSLINRRLIFTTLIPSSANCATAGDGWLMVLDANDGGRLKKLVEQDGSLVTKEDTAFDVNGDGAFSGADGVFTGVNLGDIGFEPGLLLEPPVDGRQLGHAIINTSGGDIGGNIIQLGKIELGRRAWRQLFLQ